MASFLSSSPTSSFLTSSSTTFRPLPGHAPSPTSPGHSPRSSRIVAFQTGGAGHNHTPTLYQVLEIPETASAADVKLAYRRLARRCHPDVVPAHDKAATTEQFLRIHAAYSLLSDSDARAKYDHTLHLASRLRSSSSSSSIWPGSVSSSLWASPPKPTPSSFSFSTSRGRSWESDQCWC